jgi:hypothetical protein
MVFSDNTFAVKLLELETINVINNPIIQKDWDNKIIEKKITSFFRNLKTLCFLNKNEHKIREIKIGIKNPNAHGAL